MTKRPEDQSATVPLAQQAEEIARQAALRARWRWVEPCVWSVRMLAALEQGAKGAKWFRLIDKVFAERNLLAALQQVAKNDGAPGVDHVSVQDFAKRFPDSIWELADSRKQGTYVPQAIRRVHIPKPGTSETRPLGIPTVRDRVVQAAVVNVIEPIFERDFAEQSYGFRPGRSCKDALRRVDALLKQGYVHVVDADLKGYFDSIPHTRLMARLEEKITDGPVLRLIESFLQAEILDEASAWTPEAGAPQGAVLSPLLSNVYLDPLDHLMAEAGFEMVRYADDFVILCRTAQEAARALELVRQWVADNGLTLHPAKTRIVDSRTASFDFLGYTFRGLKHWPRDKSRAKLKDALRAKTRRTSGESLPCVVAKVNRTLRGWYAYFQHSSYRNVYSDIDGWLRMRLRSILRKRSGRRGRGRGRDHHRWPNRYFHALGLFSLAQTHTASVQSSRR
ncbi:MAG: group II intron reverse transcriptase/maturase [Acidobacteria bacterium]|nr:group II intron reverse transcriptase/maturase [Acidobacteriota bacterium]